MGLDNNLWQSILTALIVAAAIAVVAAKAIRFIRGMRRPAGDNASAVCASCALRSACQKSAEADHEASSRTDARPQKCDSYLRGNNSGNCFH